MTTSYPAAADSFQRPSTGDSLLYLSTLQEYDMVDNIMDTLEAIEAELGLDPAGASATVLARLDAMDTAQATEDTTVSTNTTNIATNVTNIATNVTAIGLNTARDWAADVTVQGGATSLTQKGATRQVVVTLTAETLTLANAGSGLGFGNLEILSLATGRIWRVESTILDLAIPGTLTVIDGDDNGDVSLGTIATVAGALTSTEATYLASTAVAYDTVIEARNDTAHDVDATSGAVSLFLNLTVDDVDVGDLSSTAATTDLTGTITITVTDLGGIA